MIRNTGLRLAAVVVAVGFVGAAVGPALGSQIINGNYKNTSNVAAYDFHWTFYPHTLTLTASNGGAFSSTNTTVSEQADTLDVHFFNGLVGAQGWNAVSVTFDDNDSSGYTTPWWSGSLGEFIGSAGTPFSLRDQYGTTATEWTIAIDNHDFGDMRTTLVTNLQTAKTTVVYEGQALRTAPLDWSLPQSQIAIAPNEEYVFTMTTAPGEYPVIRGELSDQGYSDTQLSLVAEFTPEPATLGLVAFGLLAALRRVRK